MTNDQQKVFQITVRAPMNIALIKYWGKRNEDLILPLNDSISVNINDLYSTTTILVGPHITADSVSVNDKPVKLTETSRFVRVFEELRRLTRKRSYNEHGSYNQPDVPSPFWHFQITSKNNFPTAAGLASSASGFAAIAFAFGQLYRLSEIEIVRLARLGSGSACRSILGGFVRWKASSIDWESTCESIYPITQWPELRAVIIVCSTSEKDTDSTSGMKNSWTTSELMRARVEKVVPQRIQDLITAIKYRDFAQLAEITMRESNQLHAICLDTWPPLQYLNDSSRQIIKFVLAFNEHFGTRLAYTFDAGPNAVLLMEDATFSTFMQTFVKACDFKMPKNMNGNQYDQTTEAEIPELFPEPLKIDIRDIIVSKLGEQPRVIADH